MQQVTIDFEAAFGRQRNLVKSVRFSSDPHTRELLADMAGEKVDAQFVDLGADQTLRSKPSYAKRTERTEEALQRAARLQLLPVSFRQRCLMVAAAHD